MFSPLSGAERPSRPCSHERSYSYYAETIMLHPSCELVTTGGCKSYEDYTDGVCFLVGTSTDAINSVVGFYADGHASRGVHYVKTRTQPHPVETGFCGIYIKLSAWEKRFDSSLFITICSRWKYDSPIIGFNYLAEVVVSASQSDVSGSIHVQVAAEEEQQLVARYM